MNKPSLLVVIPTFSHFDYAARAIKSVLYNTVSVEPHVIMVDDASPDSKSGVAPVLKVMDGVHPDKAWCHYFKEHGGLTRSWNFGLQMADVFQRDYCCVTNSDVLFPRGWDSALIAALEAGAHLVGPLTNAPGTEKKQDVSLYLGNYQLSDMGPKLDDDCSRLQIIHGSTFKESSINGFCMLARTSTWHAHAYDATHVFCPRNEKDSKGRKNPDPLNCLGEYELQGRWRAAGLKIGFCRGSFVFHYRSVTRGDAYKSPGAYRAKP